MGGHGADNVLVNGNTVAKITASTVTKDHLPPMQV